MNIQYCQYQTHHWTQSWTNSIYLLSSISAILDQIYKWLKNKIYTCRSYFKAVLPDLMCVSTKCIKGIYIMGGCVCPITCLISRTIWWIWMRFGIQGVGTESYWTGLTLVLHHSDINPPLNEVKIEFHQTPHTINRSVPYLKHFLALSSYSSSKDISSLCRLWK
jgi:hypothetical protein